MIPTTRDWLTANATFVARSLNGFIDYFFDANKKEIGFSTELPEYRRTPQNCSIKISRTWSPRFLEQLELREITSDERAEAEARLVERYNTALADLPQHT
jgi:hypothetical protein